jgi:hypothetical protein
LFLIELSSTNIEVIDRLQHQNDGQFIVNVTFIDYGNSAVVKDSELIVVDNELVTVCGKGTLCHPALALECAIKEIAPNPLRSPKGIWDDDAIAW